MSPSKSILLKSPEARTASPTAVMAVAMLLICSLGAGLVACQKTPDPSSLAQELIENGKLAPALDVLAAAVEANPSDPQIQFEYGRLLARMRLWGRSVWSLRRAATTEGFDNVEAALKLLATSYARSGNQLDATRIVDELIERDPDNAEARQMRARTRVADHLEELAIEDIDWLLSQDTTHDTEVVLLELKLKALLQLELADEAQAVLDEVRAQVDVEEDAQRAARLCALNANFAAERERFEIAEAGFEECIDGYPESRIVVQKAVAFFDSRGEPKRATAILVQAVEDSKRSIILRAALASRFRQL
ncbi:MAG: hypothetical protein VCB25_03490, partial [Myxococcota bacterium]